MEEVLRLVDLWDRKRDVVETFSGGMKRHWSCRGLIHYPDVLFLDEPTIGLDPQTQARPLPVGLRPETEARQIS